MTNDEKAKAYDEALKRAKEICNADDSTAIRKERLADIFPELRESEDEKIRGLLLWLCDEWEHNPERRTIPADIGIIKQIRKYLEKQKEQKPCEDSGTDGDIMQYIEEGEKRGIKEVISFPEKYGLQKEQKPAEWSEEDERIIKDAIYALEEIGGYPCTVKGLKSLRPQPKQEWSEEDKKMRNNIVLSLQYLIEEFPNADFIDSVKKEKQWLKSLPLNLKKKNEDVTKLCSNEWNEEDEKMYTIMNSVIKSNIRETSLSNHIDRENLFKLKNWLENRFKSLSPRPSWKPSEEQLEELWNVISYIEKPGSNFLGVPALLESLYEQLKKL